MKIAVFSLVAVASFGFYVLTYSRVYPEAALQIEVSRAEAIEIARATVERQMGDLSAYRHAVSFNTDSNTKSFLEKEFGLGVANDLMGDEIRTWYWWVRWFIPEQQEEFGAAIDPSGRLVFYAHQVEEDRAEESVDPQRAEQIARSFIALNTSLDLGQYERIATRETEQPNRTDHRFTWKRLELELDDAEYEIIVDIEGSRVGYFSEYLDVPQDWVREENRKYSRRSLIMTVASLLESLFGFAAMGVLVWAMQAKVLRWKFALGVSVLMMALSMAISINDLSGAWMNYSTVESVPSFYGDLFMGIAGSLVAVPVSLIILMGPGEALARRVLPGHLSMSHVFRWAFWRSESTVSAIAAGWGLAALHLGYVSAFYLLADALGAWSPQSSPALGALATPFPWLYPISTGAFASLEEEFTFRLFAITFLLLATKSRVIAVIVPAIIWAFLHSAYPQEPVYIRGLELTIVGIVYGVFFLRFGLVSTLIAHYAYNALVSATFLLRSADTVLAFSGALTVAVVILPALPAFIGYLRGRKLLSHNQALEALESRHAPPKIEPSSDAAKPEYLSFSPLPRKRRIALVVIAGLSIPVLLFVPTRMEFGDYVEVEIDFREATKLADRYMVDRGVDLTEYQSTVDFHTTLDSNTANYLAQHMSRRELNETFKQRFSDRPHWHIKYFRPQEVEGYGVLVGMDGGIVEFNHWLPEEAAGPQLSAAAAQSIAEAHIASDTDINLSTWRIVDSNTEEREARNDHWFVWEDDSEKVGEATYRISISVVGDEVVDLNRYLEIPEAWSRERSERRLSDTVFYGVVTAIGALGAAVLFVFAFDLIRKKQIQIGAAVVVAMFTVAAQLVWTFNSLNEIWDNYGTSAEPAVYLSETLIYWFVNNSIQTFAMAFMAVVFMDAAYRYVFPCRYPLAYWIGLPALAHPGVPVSDRPPLRLAWAEGLLVALAVVLFLEASSHFMDADWFHGDSEIEAESIHDDAPSSVIHGGYDSIFPAMGIIAYDIQENLPILAFAIGLFCVWRRYFFRLPWAVVLVVLGAVIVTWGDAHSMREGLEMGVTNLLVMCMGISIVFFLAKWFLRDNLPAYFLCVLMIESLGRVNEFLQSHNTLERTHGFILLAVLILSAAVAFVVYMHQLKALSRRRYGDASMVQ
jgi:membrane protease YdiL (CAAX protease family)